MFFLLVTTLDLLALSRVIVFSYMKYKDWRFDFFISSLCSNFIIWCSFDLLLCLNFRKYVLYDSIHMFASFNSKVFQLVAFYPISYIIRSFRSSGLLIILRILLSLSKLRSVCSALFLRVVRISPDILLFSLSSLSIFTKMFLLEEVSYEHSSFHLCS